MNRFKIIVATVCGTGYFPVASGTVGTLFTFVVFWFLDLPQATPTDRVMFVVAALFLYLLGIRVLEGAEEHFGRKDPSPVVIDEAAGSAVTLFLVPHTLTAYAIAFLAFRIADIIKPFPARRSERLPGGLGIMTDDMIAGVYACLLTHLILAVAA